MSGVTFSHPAVTGALRLRLPPTSVDWSYNLVTSKTPTYAGEVVQILSVNFDKLILVGRLGHEGAFGTERKDGVLVRRRNVDWNTNLKYGVGLVQMVGWFREYFAIASQGRGREGQNYREEPVVVTYEGAQDINVDTARSELSWKVYPVSFPSYRRAHDNFAPEWKVECEVYEAPGVIKDAERIAAVDRLAYRPLHLINNPFSDPAGMLYGTMDTDKKKAVLLADAKRAAMLETENVLDYYNEFITSLGTTEIRELILAQASIPADVTPISSAAGKKAATDRLNEARSRRRITDDALRTFDEG